MEDKTQPDEWYEERGYERVEFGDGSHAYALSQRQVEADKPELVMCEFCKELRRPGFLCYSCGSLVRFPPPEKPSSQDEIGIPY
jgi:hypothetical protein